jgi:hypothetical protein
MANIMRWGLLLLLLGWWGAGPGTASAAVQSNPNAPPPDTLVITSEPPGAAVTVLVDETDVFRIKAGQEFKPTDLQGVTPWQVKLTNNKMGRYFIEFKKGGYEPEYKQVDVEEVAAEGVSEGRKTAAKVLDIAGQAVGMFAKKSDKVQDGLSKGSQFLETDFGDGSPQLKFNPNPMHAVLKPQAPGAAQLATGAAPTPVDPKAGTFIPRDAADRTLARVQAPAAPQAPGQAQTAQAYEISCLFSSLVLEDQPVLAEVQRPICAKLGPAGKILVVQGEPQRLRCASLLQALEQQGKRISFSEGVMYLGEVMFNFEEGAYIVAREPGTLVGCGISRDDEESGGRPRTRKSKRASRKSEPPPEKVQGPADQEEDD